MGSNKNKKQDKKPAEPMKKSAMKAASGKSVESNPPESSPKKNNNNKKSGDPKEPKKSEVSKKSSDSKKTSDEFVIVNNKESESTSVSKSAPKKSTPAEQKDADTPKNKNNDGSKTNPNDKDLRSQKDHKGSVETIVLPDSDIEQPSSSNKEVRKSQASGKSFNSGGPPVLRSRFQSDRISLNSEGDDVRLPDHGSQFDESDNGQALESEEDEDPQPDSVQIEQPTEETRHSTNVRYPAVLTPNARYRDAQPKVCSQAKPPLDRRGLVPYNISGNHNTINFHPQAYPSDPFQQFTHCDNYFSAEFAKMLQENEIPPDQREIISAHGVKDRASFVSSFEARRFPEIVGFSEVPRSAAQKSQIVAALTRIHSELSVQQKNLNDENVLRRQEDVKKGKMNEVRVNKLVENFMKITGRQIFDYIRPSASLLGNIEESFLQGKIKYIHIGEVTSHDYEMALEGENNKNKKTAAKNYPFRHYICYLQRLKTLLNAYLLLSYEKRQTSEHPDAHIIPFTVAGFDQYVAAIERFMMIASVEDSSQMGQQALFDIDCTWRHEWADRPAFCPGTTHESPENSLDDLIADQVSKKVSRAQFVQSVKTFKTQNNFSHSYPQNNSQNNKNEKKWSDQNSNSSKNNNWNDWKKNDSDPEWFKHVPKAGGKGTKAYQNFQNTVNQNKNNKGGNKRPTSVESSPQPNKKTRAVNKGVICQYAIKGECNYGKKCLYAHSLEEIYEYQNSN